MTEINRFFVGIEDKFSREINMPPLKNTLIKENLRILQIL